MGACLIGVSVFRWGFLSSFLDGVGGMICVVWNDLIWIHNGSGTAEVVGIYVDRCMGGRNTGGNVCTIYPSIGKGERRIKKKKSTTRETTRPSGLTNVCFSTPQHQLQLPSRLPKPLPKAQATKPSHHITSHHHISLGTNILIVHRHSY